MENQPSTRHKKPTKWRRNLSPPLSGTLLHLACFHAHNGPELANASSPLSEHDHSCWSLPIIQIHITLIDCLVYVDFNVGLKKTTARLRPSTWRTELWAIDRISHLRWLSMGWAGQNEKHWQLNTWIQENVMRSCQSFVHCFMQVPCRSLIWVHPSFIVCMIRQRLDSFITLQCMIRFHRERKSSTKKPLWALIQICA